MSVRAITWAFEPKPGLGSADKFVLVSLADNADDLLHAWPAVSTISRKTQLDRKTILAALHRLEKSGWIRDTGQRCGLTKQIKIFELLIVEGSQKRDPLDGENSDAGVTIKEAQKRDSSDGGKQSLISAETVPKTAPVTVPNLGHGTVKGTIIEPPPCRSPNGERPAGEVLINDFNQAKSLICKKILGGKDPARPWSYNATHALQRQLPIPLRELLVVSWFRNLPNDPTVPELALRRQTTENGLTEFWSDEVTRAEAYWRKAHPAAKAKKKDPPRWREFLRWKYGDDIRLPNEFEDLDEDQRNEYARDFETFQEATK
jgi:hypothetical protein